MASSRLHHVDQTDEIDEIDEEMEGIDRDQHPWHPLPQFEHRLWGIEAVDLTWMVRLS
eukprot:CAMPEP_0195025554 /NCGR_PEP_ID=MMETSP0326_2-20130528/48035_1 /TAXON_ID=2866 ORGANISM="Crypthecodinium cohnii, Strain Seligo" /NCGR_SAMPLE_ID=MMETSP0326_2 /ASSEMBLY_ACC=CAM_ASM_000348 /LENGTH=57 /DNA_ID=CAMNT_0040046959 /DNA_START=309 /DNA_END=479 /DNA_ORIENTATION=+